MERPNWDDYFIEISSIIAKRGTCLRRVYGAVIVKDNKIISTGYNGAPTKEINCCTIRMCKRQELDIPSGERYELCRAVHAEANAIIQANPNDMNGATIYIAGWEVGNIPWNLGREVPTSSWYAEAHPCRMCTRMIKNAKIKEVKWRKKDGSIGVKLVKEMVEE